MTHQVVGLYDTSGLWACGLVGLWACMTHQGYGTPQVKQVMEIWEKRKILDAKVMEMAWKAFNEKGKMLGLTVMGPGGGPAGQLNLLQHSR